jgi:hypothetical protein
VVMVEISLDLNGRAVIVAMHPLAVVAVVRDEMPRAKDQVILGNANLEK